MKKTTSTPTATPTRGLLALAALALVESGLSIYQWLELIHLRRGGETVCNVSATVNCDTVWTSAFASNVHNLLGMPVAALGLVWGLTALVLPLVAFWMGSQQKPLAPVLIAIRLVAVVGALSIIPLVIGSVNAGALCLTCLGTYVLVAGYAAAAFLMIPKALIPGATPLAPALGWAVGVAVVMFLILQIPARSTPKDFEGGLGSTAKGGTGPVQTSGPAKSSEAPKPPPIEEYLKMMPATGQQGMSDALEAWKTAKKIDPPGAPRILYGPADAPTKIVEFTDMKCGHCGTLINTLRELKRVVPAGLISIEPRHYPLDSECNPQMKFSDGSGTRCLGAKALICLEQSPDYWRIQDQLFAEQARLNRDRILEVASSGSVNRSQLEQCVQSPETQKKLADDIAYATQHDIHGTPLVVVNGKTGFSAGPFLYAMAMTKSDPEHPAWKQLPAPRPPQAHDDH